MVIIKIAGGLGNQMFQYAFALRCQLEGLNVLIDISDFNITSNHNGFEIERIFDLNITKADSRLIDALADFNSSLLSKIRRKVFGKKKTHIGEKRRINLMNLKQVYLDGYWQSEDYFSKYSDKIRSMYQFPQLKGTKNLNIKNLISQTNSVSIHVRRGDYVSNNNIYNEYGRICDRNYFQKAINYVKSKTPEPTFFIFSNDIEWCRNNLEMHNKHFYIDWNKGRESYIDMQLMAECNHNIIPNSSFSWWGAWLGNKKNKLVVAPDRWKFSEQENSWRTPKNWHRIKTFKS